MDVPTRSHCPLGRWLWKPIEQPLGTEHRGQGLGVEMADATDRNPGVPAGMAGGT